MVHKCYGGVSPPYHMLEPPTEQGSQAWGGPKKGRYPGPSRRRDKCDTLGLVAQRRRHPPSSHPVGGKWRGKTLNLACG
eukprot:5806834-Pleurochrysis_carterae.AAC.2